MQEDLASLMSFTSSVHSLQADTVSHRRREEIDAKIECVNSLASVINCNDLDKLSRTLEATSSSAPNCALLRSHRVIPMLVKILHNTAAPEVRILVAKNLELSKISNNIIFCVWGNSKSLFAHTRPVSLGAGTGNM